MTTVATTAVVTPGSSRLGSSGPAARPDANAVQLGSWLMLVGQLLLLLVAVKRFNLESEAFFRLCVLTVAGFAVHYFVPLRFRLPFFVLPVVRGHRADPRC